MSKNSFENIVPISHGHEVRKEKALEKGDLHTADKEEVEKLLLEMQVSSRFDSILESRAQMLIAELIGSREAYKGYSHLAEVEECTQMIKKLEEAVVIFSQKP